MTITNRDMDTSSFFNFCYKNSRVSAMLVLNTEGKILQVNQAFTNNYGYENEEIEGLDLTILFNKSDRDMDKPQA